MPVIARGLLVALALCASVSAAADPANGPNDSSGPSALPSCGDPAITARLGVLIHARRFADAHHAAVGLRVLCPPEVPGAWRVLDDIALLRLEDRPWALEDLSALARGPDAMAANVVLAWAYVTDRDPEAALVALHRLPAERAAAIVAFGALDDADAFAAAIQATSPAIAHPARVLAAHYLAARQARPALAGVLSAVIPGAGQLYAGSLQAAATTFVLNGLFIGATVELAGRHDYVTAAAAASAASFFYVGGIMNAVDLARRRNRLAMQPYADELERLLVPELDGL